MNRKSIDPEKLSKEIKKRPILYDFKTFGFNHYAVRKSQWDEVAKTMFHEVWDFSTAIEKEILGKLFCLKIVCVEINCCWYLPTQISQI